MKQYNIAVKFPINRGGILFEERVFGTYYPKEKALEKARMISQLYPGREVRVTHRNWNTVKGTPIFKDGKEM